MSVEIIAVGGYEEVGKNMSAIKVGEDVVIFDMGIHLDRIHIHEDTDIARMHSLDLIERGIIPDDTLMKDVDGKVRAIVFTHGHLDHIGAVAKLAHRYEAPLIATPYTMALVRISPTFCTSSFPYACSNLLTGDTAWSPNLINVQFNQIADNLHWGIFEDRNGVAGSGWTGSLHNTYENNDLEANGSCIGCTQYGAIYIGKSTVDTVRNNYFEVSTRQIVLGELGSGAFFAANSPIIRDNFFTTRTLTPYNIELENTVGALIDGNSEQIQTTNSSNCFINAATSGESQTFIGHNLYFQNTGGNTGNALCINGSPAGLLAGANSFSLANSTFQLYIANGDYQTASTGTSETVTLANITASSYCFVTPWNATAATFPFSPSTFYVIPGAGMVTYFHPSGANGVRVNIWCATT